MSHPATGQPHLHRIQVFLLSSLRVALREDSQSVDHYGLMGLTALSHGFLLMCLPPAVFSGVVTAVVFIAVCALAVISRLLYQQRRAQRSNSIKEDNRHSMYTDYRTEMHLHNSVRDNMKEYYI